jgi:hypothetical protein
MAQVSSGKQQQGFASGFDHKERLRCFFCGGAKCKRCGDTAYLQQENPALDRFNSSWITKDVLAMQRPSDAHFETVNLLKQFIDNGISAVFNLTEPGEHPYCGHGIIEKTGFPYTPEKLMEGGIKHFNYAFPDMTVPSIDMMRDITTVACHEFRMGGKIAVHCHAGFGRTGIAVACVLIVRDLLTASQAVQLVRMRRPGSVQTSRQESFVQDFEAFHLQRLLVFPDTLEHADGGRIDAVERTISDSVKDQNDLTAADELEAERGLRWMHKVLLFGAEALGNYAALDLHRLCEAFTGYRVLEGDPTQCDRCEPELLKQMKIEANLNVWSLFKAQCEIVNKANKIGLPTIIRKRDISAGSGEVEIPSKIEKETVASSVGQRAVVRQASHSGENLTASRQSLSLIRSSLRGSFRFSGHHDLQRHDGISEAATAASMAVSTSSTARSTMGGSFEILRDESIDGVTSKSKSSALDVIEDAMEYHEMELAGMRPPPIRRRLSLQSGVLPASFDDCEHHQLSRTQLQSPQSPQSPRSPRGEPGSQMREDSSTPNPNPKPNPTLLQSQISQKPYVAAPSTAGAKSGRGSAGSVDSVKLPIIFGATMAKSESNALPTAPGTSRDLDALVLKRRYSKPNLQRRHSMGSVHLSPTSQREPTYLKSVLSEACGALVQFLLDWMGSRADAIFSVSTLEKLDKAWVTLGAFSQQNTNGNGKSLERISEVVDGTLDNYQHAHLERIISMLKVIKEANRGDPDSLMMVHLIQARLGIACVLTHSTGSNLLLRVFAGRAMTPEIVKCITSLPLENHDSQSMCAAYQDFAKCLQEVVDKYRNDISHQTSGGSSDYEAGKSPLASPQRGAVSDSAASPQTQVALDNPLQTEKVVGQGGRDEVNKSAPPQSPNPRNGEAMREVRSPRRSHLRFSNERKDTDREILVRHVAIGCLTLGVLVAADWTSPRARRQKPGNLRTKNIASLAGMSE